MKPISRLRVHIAPLGFEVDRIVLPAIKLKADMVCLLVHSNRSEDKAKVFEEEIRQRLKECGIQVRSEYADRTSLFGILRAVKEIIQGDTGINNDIYVNVSSGSKIQSIACMMACMMWNDADNLTPYYAEPETYTSPESAPQIQGGDAKKPKGAGMKSVQMSSGLKDITELPKYRIQIPKRDLIKALEIVHQSEGGRIKKSDMAEKAEDAGIITVNSKEENRESAKLMSLAKNIVDPLTDDWKFLRTDKTGRTRWVSLTKEGQNAAEFLL